MSTPTLELSPDAAFGDRLRGWRRQRRLSQLDLAGRAEVSTRHISFLETGRSKPSREMVAHLAHELDVPLRQRNALLAAAGYAPAFSERGLAEEEMSEVLAVVAAVLDAHTPFPALVVDRQWNLLRANDPAMFFLDGVTPELLEAPINVVRVSLHPDGLARRVANFEEYAAHMISRLERQLDHSGDSDLGELLDECRGYLRNADLDAHTMSRRDVTLPLQVLADSDTVVSMFSTISVFGAPNDITVEEVAIEAFYPADEVTRVWFEDRFSAP